MKTLLAVLSSLLNSLPFVLCALSEDLVSSSNTYPLAAESWATYRPLMPHQRMEKKLPHKNNTFKTPL